MTNTPETPEEDAGSEKPARDDVVRRLHKKFAGLDAPKNQPMTEERFMELDALSDEERTRQLSEEELAEFEELKDATGKLSKSLASLHVKPALAGYDASKTARALGTHSAIKGLDASFATRGLSNLNSASKIFDASSATKGLIGSYLKTANVLSAAETLIAQYPSITSPAVEGFTRTILASSGWDSASKLISASAMATFRSPQLQRLISPTSAFAASNLLSVTPTIDRLISDMAWRFEIDEDDEEPDEDMMVAQVKELVIDEQTLEEAWRDIEGVLLSDRDLRRRIKSDARQLAPRTKLKRKTVEKLLLVIVWVCAVLLPWTDGEKKLDDITVPIGTLAGEIAAYLAVHPESRKNPLQKNGPRRRRHRRKRKK